MPCDNEFIQNLEKEVEDRVESLWVTILQTRPPDGHLCLCTFVVYDAL